MTRFPALALALALAGPGTACKKQPQQKPDRHGRSEALGTAPPAPAVHLPRSHELSREPDAAMHVAAPAATLAAVAGYLPVAPSLAELTSQVLATQGPNDWARAVGPQIDGVRPWTGASVAGEDILHFPLQPGGAARVNESLAKFPKRGEFGAAVLPAAALVVRGGLLELAKAPGPQRLAWVDPATETLTIAGTLEGLATGRELAGAYGKQPLYFSIAEARGAALFGKFPYGRIVAVGPGLHHLDITASARPGQALPVLRDIAPGPLAGALAGKGIAAGVSTRWTGYKYAVREATHQMQVQVDRTGFAGKMMLDPIADQATRVMKMWNGRVLLAVGPAWHLRRGLRADDPHAAHRGLLTLLRDITDNLQLARMFVSNIPNASLKKLGDNPDMWLLTASGIANQFPPALRGLLDDGRLRLAFNGSAHVGGVLIVIGPRADSELKAWLAEAGAAVDGKEGMKELAHATAAVSPAAVASLLQQGTLERLLAAVLGLSADRPPTQLVMRQSGSNYEITVRGPEVAAPAR